MYSPDMATPAALAATGAAVAWNFLSVGVLIIAGAALLTVVSVLRKRRADLDT